MQKWFGAMNFWTNSAKVTEIWTQLIFYDPRNGRQRLLDNAVVDCEKNPALLNKRNKKKRKYIELVLNSWSAEGWKSSVNSRGKLCPLIVSNVQFSSEKEAITGNEPAIFSCSCPQNVFRHLLSHLCPPTERKKRCTRVGEPRTENRR